MKQVASVEFRLLGGACFAVEMILSGGGVGPS